MDALQSAILASDVLLATMNAAERYGHLATGIAAKAHSENRDVTAEEQSLIDGLLDIAEKRRRGE